MWTLPEKDREACAKFSAQRETLLLYKTCFDKYKHLIGGTSLRIRRATQDDYRYDATLNDLALIVNWSFERGGCKNVSCVGTYPPGKSCALTDKPFGLLTGKNVYERNNNYFPEDIIDVCAPQCFHLKSASAAKDTLTIAAKHNAKDISFPPTLVWNDQTNACQYDVSPGIMKLFLDPSSRLSDTYSPLRDDVIFTLARERLATFPETKVTVGRVNQPYCSQFQMDVVNDKESVSLDPTFTNNMCDLSKAEHVLSWFTGTSLIRMVKMGHDELSILLKKAIRARSSDIQTYQTSEARFASVDAWRAQVPRKNQMVDIPLDITATNLGLIGDDYWSEWTNDPVSVANKPTDKYGGVLVRNSESEERSKIWSVLSSPPESQPPPSSSLSSPDTKKRAKRAAISTVVSKAPPEKPQLPPTTATASKVWSKIDNFLAGLIRSLSDPETYVAFAAGYEASKFVSSLRSQVKRTMSVMTTIVERDGVKTLFGLSGKAAGLRMIEMSTLHTVMSVSVRTTVSTTIRAMTTAAVASLNVLSWILILGPILDLLFALVWDPLKLCTPAFTDIQLQKIVESDLEMRVRNGTASGILTVGNFTPSDLMRAYLMNEDVELLGLQIKTSLTYNNAYFCNMKTTSEGSVVDWSVDGEFSVDDEGAMEKAFRSLSLINATPNEVDEIAFNAVQNDRVQSTRQNKSLIVGFIFFVVALSAWIISAPPVLSIVASTVALGCAAIALFRSYANAFKHT